MEKFVIIDGNNITFRSYYALPRLANFEGVVSNGVFGFCNILIKIIKDINPKYIAVAFDSAKKNFRHEMFKDYKAGRRPTPQELLGQFPILEEVLNKMGIAVVKQNGLEADDLIGCLSRQFDKTENIILTADKDCLQLITKNTFIMQPQKGITETELVDEKVLKEKMGLTPSQIIDFKGLAGDSSDNIPGVKGIGEKTAVDLLNKYSTLEGVYKHLDELKGKTKEKIEADKESAFLSKKLATIVTDKKLDYTLSDFEYCFPFNNDVLELFKKYQFNSLIKRPELFSEIKQQKNIDLVEIKTEEELLKLVDDLQKQKEIAFYLDDKKLNFSFGDVEYCVNLVQNLLDSGLEYLGAISKLKPVFENNDVKKIVFDYKKIKHTLHNVGVELSGVDFDCMIARYLINANGNNTVNYMDVVNENLLNTTTLAKNLFDLKNLYLKKMELLDTKGVFYDIEMPLVDVLYDMENQGVKIDTAQLKELETKYETKINELTEEIYELSGKKFNINSPKQLGEVLFDDLKIESYNNKKKSTNAQVLSEIVGAHPVVQKIIDYRLVSKLYTTYILAYKDIIKDNKIYTMFNQTLTSTGRLSSSEPNLQNIPVRSEEGKVLRKMFVSSFDGGKIVDADYNQIELRLLASFSGDEKMINTYNEGGDIHSTTASEVFGVPKELITPEIRRSAKAINFGIVYGISDYGLSQGIGSTVAEAGNYIKRYFERYPRIKEYMDSNVEFCKAHGYVKTMFGRLRYIPEINDSNYNLRMFGERAAMNMPLQGSASDIIKLAMIKVFNKLKELNLKSKLILQVHDELVVDTASDEVDVVKQILKTEMENVVSLKVKLIANVEVGDSWFDAH